MQKHKKNIGEEKCTYGKGVLFGYFLGVDTEMPSCGKCKYFVPAEWIDQNMNFGNCCINGEGSVKQIVDESVTLTISDFCSRFKSK